MSKNPVPGWYSHPYEGCLPLDDPKVPSQQSVWCCESVGWDKAMQARAVQGVLQPWKHSCWWQNCCILTAAHALPSLLPVSGTENGGAKQTLGWSSIRATQAGHWGSQPHSPLSYPNWGQQLKEAANLGCLKHRGQVVVAEVKKSSFSTNDPRSSITHSNQPQI